MNALPLIYVLKHAARSVRGGENAFVCWNSGSCEKDLKYYYRIFNICIVYIHATSELQ